MARPYNMVPQTAYEVMRVSEKGWNYQLSPNLQLWEVACSDGSDIVRVCMDTVAVFEEIRSLAGNKPITVSSWYRTPAYNRRIGGSKNSRHLYGMAVDMFSRYVSWEELSMIAETLNCGGVGRYPRAFFVHVDPWRINRRWTQ